MKIVIGYRETNVGQDLLALARVRAAAFRGKVAVITSLPGKQKTQAEEIREAERNLEQAKRGFIERGIPVETHLLVRGQTPGEDIVKFAEDHNADEIIIGVKSRSKVGKLIFGSTAQYVILHAHCPVTSVK